MLLHPLPIGASTARWHHVTLNALNKDRVAGWSFEPLLVRLGGSQQATKEEPARPLLPGQNLADDLTTTRQNLTWCALRRIPPTAWPAPSGVRAHFATGSRKLLER